MMVLSHFVPGGTMISKAVMSDCVPPWRESYFDTDSLEQKESIAVHGIIHRLTLRT
jgi:hypothetical protein